MLADRSSRITTSLAPVASAAVVAAVDVKNGREKAAMISAMAPMRSISRNQLWMRRRSTD